MAGILGQPYIPGLSDFRVAEADAQRRGAHALQQRLGILNLQALQEQAGMAPLRRAMLEEQLREQKRLSGILAAYSGSGAPSPAGASSAPAPLAFGEGGVSLPGGAQGNMQTGAMVPAPAQGAAPASGAPTPRLPEHVRLGLLHPKLAPLAQAEAKFYEPRSVAEGGAVYVPGQGAVYTRPKIGEGVQATGYGPTGELQGVRSIQGYPEAQGAVTAAQERERARYDLVTRPPTAPDQPPTYGSRLGMLGLDQPAAPQQTSPQPIPQAPRQSPIPTSAVVGRPPEEVAAIGRVAAAGNRPMSVTVPNAAGMSPAAAAAQKATQAGAEKTATERAEAGVKYESDILTAGQKARSNLTNLQILSPNLEKLQTGPLYPMLVNAGAYLQQFGINPAQLGQQLGTAQATDAILKQLALKLRDPGGGGGMPGALSNADRQFLVDALPSLSKAPDGNKQLMGILMGLEQRKIDEASIVSGMQRDGKNSQEIRAALDQFANSRPMFAR